MVNTSGRYAHFSFHHLDVSIYCFYSPLLDDIRCQIQWVSHRDLVSLYDILRLGWTAVL